MKTIQITIEDKLLKELDRHLNGQSRARSAFIRDTIAKQLLREKYREMERQEIEALKKCPIVESEFYIAPEFCPWEKDDGSDWSELWEKTK